MLHNGKYYKNNGEMSFQSIIIINELAFSKSI